MLQLDQKKLEYVLVKLNLVSQDQLDRIKIESVRTGEDIYTTILRGKILPKEDLVKARSISLGLPYVDLSSIKVDQKILKHLSKDMAKKYNAVPFGINGSTLNIAMINPNNVQVIEFIERSSNLRVSPYMASEEGIERVISQYQDLGAEVSEALKDVDTGKVEIKTSKEALAEITEDAPVTRAVNTILEYAIKAKASDIHIEPWENALKVRFRIDGILQETMSLPVHIQAALISRIKILSDLKIDEHRIPQDGRFDANIDDHEIDVRVAVSPTIHGEKVVMRLLDKSAGAITLENLGLRGHSFRLIEQGIKKPHGMILSTGPTGSGKTTTLYAILGKINNPGVNIITLEDPVEYQTTGVNQIQVNAAVGLTFASGLRSILRQDPDIIMVGEIRDAETADLAVQSALTGHTVLSTLHTNSASGVLPRMLDMDIEPFLIASTISTAIGQRLVRKLCDICKKPYQATPALVIAINQTIGSLLPKNQKEMKELGYQVPLQNAKNFTLYQAVGCPNCNNTGYSGRIGVYEVFNISAEMEKLVVEHATTLDVQKQAIEQGMITMRQDGFLKALEGITTIEEVIAKIAES
jgi:type IV pilus assembly protein PilB